ncbi:hypothetical protein [Phaeobacter porticola]|uniref:Uncharacterized protein n=1 Tax=Phaeobacter porticola TaxID=1844006 RepID=A0A1L3I496_9RHOB|nr:hypothetical protein [Phaeobacter porticola]APG46938.1 hypothetical protein PhaeoP97_01518 [Phaeobacter porticola]
MTKQEIALELKAHGVTLIACQIKKAPKVDLATMLEKAKKLSVVALPKKARVLPDRVIVEPATDLSNVKPTRDALDCGQPAQVPCRPFAGCAPLARSRDNVARGPQIHARRFAVHVLLVREGLLRLAYKQAETFDLGAPKFCVRWGILAGGVNELQAFSWHLRCPIL